MADKLRTQQHLEALQVRYVGTGHADTTKSEWVANLHRDSYASYVGHPPVLQYMSLGLGECRELVRMRCLEGMVGVGSAVKDKEVDGMEVDGEGAGDGGGVGGGGGR
ncbi:MAG: hypothetical protein M1831_000292 [Alyxoria varia]|nr:MAG: hypothetical protein M1831_000292 [Alyxoria varia]